MLISEILIREAILGDASRVVLLHFNIFQEQFNFNGVFEKYVIYAMLGILDDTENRILVAVNGDEVVGSIAVVKKSDSVAQLRLLSVSPKVQGQGIGNKLMKISMSLCKEKKYSEIYLLTMNILKPALNLYKKYGFYHVEDKFNDEWAPYPIIEEKWECKL